VFTVHPHDTIFGVPERGVSQVLASPSTDCNTPSLQSIVTAVEFSRARQNVLAVGTSQKEYVSLYCIKSSPSEVVSRTPLLTIPSPGGVKYLSWQGIPEESSAPPQLSIVESLFSSQREQRSPQVFSGAGIASQQLPPQPSRDNSSGGLGEETRQTRRPSVPQGAIECEVSKNRSSPPLSLSLSR
jgi:hypothetical protein